ncbi:MAG: AMP-binding enzyme family protein [Frankiales bacterium]|nr:AMP-binding enzyme family protein [Frankiales bacterium]
MRSAPLDDRGLWPLVETRAARTPDAPFLVDEDQQPVTFAQFRNLVDDVAARLRLAGVSAGSRVSWQLPTSVDSIAVMAALARLGAVQNPVITALRQRDLDVICAEFGSELLLVPESFRGFDHAAMAREVAARSGTRVLVWPSADTTPAPAAPPAEPPADGVRWVFYTSGTTSRPKGVKHTDASVVAGSDLLVDRFGLTPADVAVLPFPITHIGGPILVSAALRVGFSLFVAATFDPATTPYAMATAGVTVLGSSPGFYPGYLSAQQAYGPRPLFPGLRLGLSGGAPGPVGLHERVRDELGGVGLLDPWGLTECPLVTGCAHDDTDGRLGRTNGRPAPGVRVRVVGPDGADLPAGQEGELRVTGPQLFAGYVDPSLDAEALDAAGFLRTGDLGRIDAAGYVSVTGRLKDVVVRNAENISAAEVEGVLQEHPAVRDAAVVGLPDARTGERCCAVLVLTPGHAPPLLTDVTAFCTDRGMTPYKLPEQLEWLDELPRNSMGKVEKALLRERFADAPSATSRS